MRSKGSTSSNKKKATARGRGGVRETAGKGAVDTTPDSGMARPGPSGRHRI